MFFQASMNEQILLVAIGVAFSAVSACVGFVVTRFIAGRDQSDEKIETVTEARHQDLRQLTKDIGLLEAAKDRSLEADIRIMNKLDQIEREQRNQGDRLLIIETTLKAHR